MSTACLQDYINAFCGVGGHTPTMCPCRLPSFLACKEGSYASATFRVFGKGSSARLHPSVLRLLGARQFVYLHPRCRSMAALAPELLSTCKSGCLVERTYPLCQHALPKSRDVWGLPASVAESITSRHVRGCMSAAESVSAHHTRHCAPSLSCASALAHTLQRDSSCHPRRASSYHHLHSDSGPEADAETKNCPSIH
jgi:hypothetical protein